MSESTHLKLLYDYLLRSTLVPSSISSSGLSPTIFHDLRSQRESQRSKVDDLLKEWAESNLLSGAVGGSLERVEETEVDTVVEAETKKLGKEVRNMEKRVEELRGELMK